MASSDNVCQHFKYGFCKYQEKCRQKHTSEICLKKDCEIDKCSQRHPRVCKYYREYKRCKFGSFCAYRHEDSKENVDKASTEKTIEMEKKISCLSELLDLKSEEVRNLELKLNTFEKLLKQTEVQMEKFNTWKDIIDQLSGRVQEVETNNYILIHAVDDVEKAAKVIESKFEAISVLNFACNSCDEVFQSDSELQNHKRNSHGRVRKK